MARTPTTALIALVCIAGCAPSQAPQQGQAAADDSYGTGAMLSTDYFGDTDVEGFHFEIERVSCDASDAFTPWSLSATVDLLDGILPAMVSLVEQVFDPASRHLASDLFVSLEPGCYDILAVPAADIDGESWSPSADCAAASAEGIQVDAGQTTEATLISQCVGDDTGALDTLVLLNHPPVISVSIDEKFNYECEPVEVCVTAYDPDDDPLKIDWANLSATNEFSISEGPLEVVGFEEGHRVWQQCTEIVTRWTASYDFQVVVQDLGRQGGVEVPMEDITGEPSRAELTFPIHTNWIEEPQCIDANDNLVMAEGAEIERAPGCSYTDAETFYCSGAYSAMVDPDIVEFLCDGTELIEEALYPECD